MTEKGQVTQKAPSRLQTILRWVAGVTGSLFVLIALMAEQTQVGLFMAGLACFLITLLGKRLSGIYTPTAVILLNTVLLVTALELTATAVFALATSTPVRSFLAGSMNRPDDVVEHHYKQLPYYAQQEWTAQYWKEHRLALKKKYHPYVIWRSPPFEGETLNIGQDGIRSTPGSTCDADAYTVFTFGGSAMWGWGAPDWGTIPAYLQHEFSQGMNQPVCIVNYGEQAYVALQNQIQLLLLLESDTTPDLVVFYDGVNDVLAAHQNGRTQWHQNFDAIARRFQDETPPLLAWVQGFSLYRITTMLLGFTGLSASPTSPDLPEPAALADDVLRTYLNNYRVVESLSESYHFDFAFFWQPYILAGNKPLTPEEQAMVTGLNWVFSLTPSLSALFHAIYNQIATDAPKYPYLYDLSSALNEAPEQIWIDTWGHMTPEGNRIIAQQMSEYLTQQIQRSSPPLKDLPPEDE